MNTELKEIIARLAVIIHRHKMAREKLVNLYGERVLKYL